TLRRAKKDSFGNVVWDSPEVSRLLEDWLRVKPKSQNLFCSVTGQKKVGKKGLTKPGGKLSRNNLTVMIKNRAKKVGIIKTVGFHTLRHSYATHLLIHTGNIDYVRQQLRHKSIVTTSIYLKSAWQFTGHKCLNGFKL
ncbi:unnamed protein product, partial [marine sediment metagenome]